MYPSIVKFVILLTSGSVMKFKGKIVSDVKLVKILWNNLCVSKRTITTVMCWDIGPVKKVVTPHTKD